MIFGRARTSWLLFVTMVGCSATDAPDGAAASSTSEQPVWDCFGCATDAPHDGPLPQSRYSDASHSAERAACRYERGALPRETLGNDIVAFNAELGEGVFPIQKLVILMQENRSFDHYYGKLNEYRRARFRAMGDPRGQEPIPAWSEGNSTWADVPVVDENGKYPWNPVHTQLTRPTEDQKFYWEHAPFLCTPDTSHSWSSVHLQYNGGLMNGFVQTSHMGFSKGDPKVPLEFLHGRRAMWHYDETDLPFYYELANTFSIADRYFSSVLGATNINRDFLYAGTRFGITGGLPEHIHRLHKPVVITDMLEDAGHTYRFYLGGNHGVEKAIPRIATVLGHNPLELVSRGLLRPGKKVDRFAHFVRDARKGTLPAVSFIDGDLREDVDGEDEHAPANIHHGQKFTYRVLDALMNGPDWERTALIITYDEHGGLYDHVPPPTACVADKMTEEANELAKAANRETRAGAADDDLPPSVERLGVRVPMMVISAWSKPGHVSHRVYDHTSITRLIEWMLQLPAMSKRDANALPPLDMFDFTRMNFPAAAVRKQFARAPVVDRAKNKECHRLFRPARGFFQHFVPTRTARDRFTEDSVPVPFVDIPPQQRAAESDPEVN